jgi:hypothetical protein
MPMPPPINALAPENLNMLSRAWSMVTDPFTIQKQVNQQAIKEYGWKERVNGRGDAFRHLVGTAMLAQKHGAPYAEFVTTLHENPYLPFVGALYHSKEDREMDLYNNRLGLELATQAKDYDDLLKMARQYIDTGKARTLPAK